MMHFGLNFGPFVMRSEIDNYMRLNLLKTGQKLTKEDDFNKALAGSLTTQLEIKDTKWFEPYLNMYVQYYFDGYARHFKLEQYTKERHLTKLWINYQGPNDYQPPHVHDNADLSFVIYCDIPKELKKEYDDFIDIGDNKNKIPPGTITFEYGENMPGNLVSNRFMPYNNQIFIFPAWLKHYVMPFKKNVKRISVSGNIKFGKDPKVIEEKKIKKIIDVHNKIINEMKEKND
jgi:uncharacterized protein (TIGR02466 family)